jgi:NAD(P)H-hydrate epimerase
VCLKGRATVVTDGERVYVNETGNAGMATAGAGDVLTGIVVAYLAQTVTLARASWTAFDAAACAVRVHGIAGDLAAARVGERALVASDLIAFLAEAQRLPDGR